jgi:ATP synthase protein I
MTHMSDDPESADAQKREHRASSRREENAMWSIFGYLLSGLLFWGGVGWAADRFFNTTYLTLIGLLVGMGGALYLVWLRFGRE